MAYRRLRYCGKDPRLAGQTALTVEYEGQRPSDTVLVQFDSLILTPYCFGWHSFPVTDFEPPEESGAEVRDTP